MPATQADVDQLDAILNRLDDHTKARPDPALDAIADDLTRWYRRMFRPAPPADDDLVRVQRVLDRLDFRVASLGADPELVARVDELKAGLELALGPRRPAAAGRLGPDRSGR